MQGSGNNGHHMGSTKAWFLSGMILALLIASDLVANATLAGGRAAAAEPKDTAFSGDPDKPRRHFRARDVADMSAEEREALYQRIRQRLRAGYALADDAASQNYQDWTRVNSAPYGSATHGKRFINNYANTVAGAYRNYETAGALPEGAIIAKDSFVVASDGTVTPGPLFLMEKMQKGFSYVSGDWRYTMILPDGSVFGVTNGENAERVEFCIGCHLAREKFDHLFFVPKAYRTN